MQGFTHRLPWRLSLALAGLVLLGWLLLSLGSSPPPPAPPLTTAERAWVQAWWSAHRPQRLATGQLVTLKVTPAEANRLGAYLLEQFGRGRAVIALADDRALLHLSLSPPWDPQANLVNLDLELAGGTPLPRIVQARLVGIPLPSSLVQALAERFMRSLGDAALIQAVRFQPDMAEVTYRWHPQALEQLGTGLLDTNERARLLLAQDRLVRFASAQPPDQALPLTDTLAHLLTDGPAAGSLALAGSSPSLWAAETAPGDHPAPGVADEGPATLTAKTAASDAVAANRAAFLALAAYAARRTLPAPGLVATDSAPRAFRTLILRGRRDLAQHFIGAAALASQGGDTLADLLSLAKEMNDMASGSGFSFADLAADLAGTHFSRYATRDQATARALRLRARAGLAENDLMPNIQGLPEGIGKATFAADYGSTHSPAYKALQEVIERRINALGLFR